MRTAASLLWNRILAFAVDYLVISAYLVLLAASLALWFTPLGPGFRALFADPAMGELTGIAVLVLPVLLYFSIFEASPWEGTWGKRARGLRVVTLGGERLSLPRALLRNALKLAPWELAHACIWHIPGWPLAPQTPAPWVSAGLVGVWVLVAIYIVSLLLSRSGQTIYDRLAGVYVVRVRQVAAAPAASRLG